MSIESLQKHIKEGTLIRNRWTGKDAQGRATACLLAALVPEVVDAQGSGEPRECPAEVMPEWLAHLTPWIDDAGSAEAWPGTVTRYADLANRWHVLNPEAWARLDYAVRAICVREAMRYTKDERVLGVCEVSAVLCERAAKGEPVSKEEWRAAAYAAAGAARAAAYAAAGAARAALAPAADAAYAAAYAAGAYAAAGAAGAARAASYASYAPYAADRAIGLMLDAIENAICAAENK